MNNETQADQSYEERQAQLAREGVGPAPGDETGVKPHDEGGAEDAGYNAQTVPELQELVRERGIEYRLDSSVSESRKDDLVAALEADDENEGR